MYDFSPQSNTVAIPGAQPIPPCMYARPPSSSPNLLEATATTSQSLNVKEKPPRMPACRKPRASSFSMTPEGYKDTLLLAQRVGKKINLVKKNHGFSCDKNSKKGFSSCCTEKATCCEVMSSLAACALWRSCYLLLSGIRARTGHPHQPLHCLPPLGVPQLLAIDQGSRAVKENPLTCS